MVMPLNVHPGAVQLFETANWIWSDARKAFMKTRNPERETTEEYRRRSPATKIYEEIHDHGLIGSAPVTEQEAGLRWLRERLSVLNRSMK
jgi:hypothetical protein